VFNRIFRNALAVGAVVTCASAFSYETSSPVRVLLVEQTRPGEVVVQLQSTDTAPLSAGQLSLHLAEQAAVISPSHFAQRAVTSEQAALLICIDRSGSMGVAGVNAVATALRRALVPVGGALRLPITVSLITFATTTQHITKGFTDDPAQIEAALANLRVESGRSGKTHLNDAIAGGVAELRANPAPFRRMLVISDGNDEGSEIDATVMMEHVKSARPIEIDAVALGKLAADASGSLMTVSGASGGEFAFVDTQEALTGVVALLARQFATGDRYEAVFNFAPVSDGHTAEKPRLLYAGSTILLNTPITAMAIAAPPARVESPQEEPWWKKLLKALFEISLDFKFQVFVGVASALGVTAAASSERVRRKIRNFILVIVKHPPTTATPPAQPGNGGAPMPAPRQHTRVIYSWPAVGDGRSVALFEGRTGSVNGRRWTMNRPTFNLGSAGDNDLILENDDYVTSHHAVIKSEGTGLHVTDLGSRNGTKVNGELLQGGGRPLLPGDRIELGETIIEVLAPNPANARPFAGSPQSAY
jgi:Mg-chelatase subunit ChlD